VARVLGAGTMIELGRGDCPEVAARRAGRAGRSLARTAVAVAVAVSRNCGC